MKKLCAKLIILVLVCTVFVLSSAQAADPAVRVAGLPHQAETFDCLLKQTVVKDSTTAAIAPQDNVSTGTVNVFYMPENLVLPVKLRVQNHGAASITYVPYVTDATAGITLPTATAAHLLTPQGETVASSRAFEGVFYQMPNITIGASGEQEVVIEVWGRKNTE